MDNLQFYTKYFEDQLKLSGYLKYATTISDNNFEIGSNKSFFNGVTTTNLIVDQIKNVSISVPKNVFFNDPYIVLNFLAGQLKDECDLYCANYLNSNVPVKNVISYDDTVPGDMVDLIIDAYRRISSNQINHTSKYGIFSPSIYAMTLSNFINEKNNNVKLLENSINFIGTEISYTKNFKQDSGGRHKNHIFTKDSIVICYKPSLTFTENGDTIEILATNIFGIATPFINNIVELDLSLG